MAKNPFAAAAGNGRMMVKTKVQSPHVGKKLHEPSHKSKVRVERSPAVPLPRSNTPRDTAKGRDTLSRSDRSPKLPGRKEPSGIVRNANKGPMRFGDQGRG